VNPTSRYVNQAVGLCDLRSLSPRVFYTVNRFDPAKRFDARYRDPYLTFVHEVTHLLHFLSTPAGLRIHLLFLGSLTYARSIIRDIAKVTNGALEIPACAPEYLSRISNSHENFKGWNRQRNSPLELLFWHRQTVASQFGTVDLPIIGSYLSGTISIGAARMLKRKVYSDSRIQEFPHVDVHLSNGSRRSLFVGALMVLENLAKFIELEHLRQMSDDVEVDRVIEEEICLASMFPYYSFWPSFLRSAGKHHGSHLEFITSLDLSLRYDVFTSDSDALGRIMGYSGDPRSAPDWDALVAKDYNPAHHFLSLLDILKANASTRPFIDRTNPESVTLFSNWLAREYAAVAGFEPAKSLNQIQDVSGEHSFVFESPLRKLVESAIKINEALAGVSISLCDYKFLFDTIANLPFHVCFNDGVVSYGGCDANEWINFVQELSLLEWLAFGFEEGCPIRDLAVCCGADRESMPASALSAWNEDPGGKCNYHHIRSRYMYALGVKSIAPNGLAIPGVL